MGDELDAALNEIYVLRLLLAHTTTVGCVADDDLAPWLDAASRGEVAKLMATKPWPWSLEESRERAGIPPLLRRADWLAERGLTPAPQRPDASG